VGILFPDWSTGWWDWLPDKFGGRECGGHKVCCHFQYDACPEVITNPHKIENDIMAGITSKSPQIVALNSE
jgi:hypothetical protein